MRKSILTLSVAAALSAPMLVAAQSAPAPAPNVYQLSLRPGGS